MKNHKFLKLLSKILLGFLAGFLLAIILVSIKIGIGYFQAYDSSVKELTVTFFDLPIMLLKQAGETYSGTTLNENIGRISWSFGFLGMFIMGVLSLWKRKKKQD